MALLHRGQRPSDEGRPAKDFPRRQVSSVDEAGWIKYDRCTGRVVTSIEDASIFFSVHWKLKVTGRKIDRRQAQRELKQCKRLRAKDGLDSCAT